VSVPGRNAEPVVFLDAVPDTEGATTVRLADGREFLDANIALHDDDVERIRTGWVCIRCYEPQSKAFPNVCEATLPNGQPMCGFPIAEKQAGEFAAMYKGSVKIGSQINWQDEAQRLNEFSEFEARTGLIIPPHVRNRNV
jgi:hypothetical protein